MAEEPRGSRTDLDLQFFDPSGLRKDQRIDDTPFLLR